MQTDSDLRDPRPDIPSTTFQDAGPGSAASAGNDATEQAYNVLRLRINAQPTRKSILDLTQSTRCIRKKFRHVSDMLVKFNKDEYAKLWREHADRFEDILKRSCETAIAASSMMQNYNDILDQVTDADPTQLMALKRKIQSFLNKLEGKVPVADQMERDLRTLVNDVLSFGKSDLNDATDSVCKRLTNELQSIQNEIQTLDMRLRSVSELADARERRWQVVGVIGILALGMLGLLAPPACIVAAGACITTSVGYGLWVGISEYNDLANKKSVIEKAKAEKEQVAASLEECKKDLINTKQEVTGIADKIATIGSIWRFLEIDMRTLVEDIDNVVRATMDVDDLPLIPSLEITREVCGTLSEYLSLYARAHITFDDETPR